MTYTYSRFLFILILLSYNSLFCPPQRNSGRYNKPGRWWLQYPEETRFVGKCKTCNMITSLFGICNRATGKGQTYKNLETSGLRRRNCLCYGENIHAVKIIERFIVYRVKDRSKKRITKEDLLDPSLVELIEQNVDSVSVTKLAVPVPRPLEGPHSVFLFDLPSRLPSTDLDFSNI